MNDFLTTIRIQLLAILKKLEVLLEVQKKILPFRDTQTENSKIVIATAVAHLGEKIANDGDLGCAEAVNFIFQKALGFPINGSPSTIDLYKSLRDINRFIEVDTPLPGDIIIAVTGTGNGTMSHGHVGICGPLPLIYSNNSDTGRFSDKWDLQSWQKYFGGQGGFISHFFRVL